MYSFYSYNNIYINVQVTYIFNKCMHKSHHLYQMENQTDDLTLM